MLRIDGDVLAVGQVRDGDMMALAIPLQRNAVMEMAFARHALAHPQFMHKRRHPMLQHAGAHRAFHIRAGCAIPG